MHLPPPDPAAAATSSRVPAPPVPGPTPGRPGAEDHPERRAPGGPTGGGPIGRRDFLLRVSVGAGGAIGARAATSSAGKAEGRPTLRFGLIADVHHDIMHDGIARLEAFVAAMTAARVDFVVQLGDFCRPQEKNRPFLDTWNRFAGPRYHVLGNHDMDGGAKREQTVAFLGLPARYYSFIRGGVKFIVLDGNDPGGAAAGYARYIAPDQAAWLAQELRDGAEPVIVFCHQPLDDPEGIENQVAIRRLLDQGKRPDGSPRVLAVFTGHNHQDWVRTYLGIHYVQINSASYNWIGTRFNHPSYDAEIHRRHPGISRTCPYRDPLWAVVTLDRDAGVLSIAGRQSAWVGPSPWEVGVTETERWPSITRPAISDRRLRTPAT